MLMLLERQSKVAAAPVAEDRIGSERARQSPLGAARVSPRSEFVPTARIPMNCLLSLACGFNAIGNRIWMEIDLSSADGPVPGLPATVVDPPLYRIECPPSTERDTSEIDFKTMLLSGHVLPRRRPAASSLFDRRPHIDAIISSCSCHHLLRCQVRPFFFSENCKLLGQVPM